MIRDGSTWTFHHPDEAAEVIHPWTPRGSDAHVADSGPMLRVVLNDGRVLTARLGASYGDNYGGPGRTFWLEGVPDTVFRYDEVAQVTNLGHVPLGWA